MSAEVNLEKNSKKKENLFDMPSTVGRCGLDGEWVDWILLTQLIFKIILHFLNWLSNPLSHFWCKKTWAIENSQYKLELKYNDWRHR